MSIEKGHTMVDNNLHRKRKIEQHEQHKKKSGLKSGAPEGFAVPTHVWHTSCKRYW